MIFDGLESSAAVSVMRTLQRIASTGRTVICSIGTVPAQVLIFRTESSVANRQRASLASCKRQDASWPASLPEHVYLTALSCALSLNVFQKVLALRTPQKGA